MGAEDVVGIVLQKGPVGLDEWPEHLAERGKPLGRGFDEHPSAVVRVPTAAGEPTRLQPVEESRDRPGREPYPLGKVARRDRAVLDEDVERFVVARAEADPLGDGAVERQSRGAPGPAGFENSADEDLTGGRVRH